MFRGRAVKLPVGNLLMICLGLGFFGLSPRKYFSETTVFVPFTFVGTCKALSKFKLKIVFLFQRWDVFVFSVEGSHIVPLTPTTAKTTAATTTTTRKRTTQQQRQHASSRLCANLISHQHKKEGLSVTCWFNCVSHCSLIQVHGTIYIYMFVLFGVSTEGFTLNMVLPGYAPRIIDVGPYMQAHVVRCCFMIRPCLA